MITHINRLPRRIERRVVELGTRGDPAEDRQRTLFAEKLCQQLEGHLLQLIAENDRLTAKLKQSRKTITHLRRGLRGSKS